MGWGERMELHEAGSAPECGAPFGAMPWMDGGDLHWGNTEFFRFGKYYVLLYLSGGKCSRAGAASPQPVARSRAP
jgi:hypothetical protein